MQESESGRKLSTDLDRFDWCIVLASALHFVALGALFLAAPVTPAKASEQDVLLVELHWQPPGPEAKTPGGAVRPPPPKASLGPKNHRTFDARAKRPSPLPIKPADAPLEDVLPTWARAKAPRAAAGGPSGKAALPHFQWHVGRHLKGGATLRLWINRDGWLQAVTLIEPEDAGPGWSPLMAALRRYLRPFPFAVPEGWRGLLVDIAVYAQPGGLAELTFLKEQPGG